MHYNTPFYIDNYEQVFPFAEFGDTQNFFVKLYYWIDRDKYAQFATPHGQYPALDKGVTAHNGKMILRTAPDIIGGAQVFFLLSEKATDRTPANHPNVIQVEQTFGYAPDVTHIRAEEVDWTQPGYFNRSSAASYIPILSTTSVLPPYSVEFIEPLNAYRVYLAVAPVGLAVGDMVRLRGWRPWTSATVEAEIFTPETPVLAISGTTVDIEALPATSRIYTVLTGEGVIETNVPPSVAANVNNANPPTGGNVLTTFNKVLNSATWYGYGAITIGQTLRLEKLGDRKSAENISVGATVERTYFKQSSGMPVQPVPFRVQRGGQMVDTLDINTQPTLAQYQAMVTNGDRVRPRSDSIGKVLGDLWYKDAYWLRAQLQ